MLPLVYCISALVEGSVPNVLVGIHLAMFHL